MSKSVRLSTSEIRDIFLKHGFTVDEDKDYCDLKPHVFDAANALQEEILNRIGDIIEEVLLEV